jgi:hypothetical protein
MTDNRDFEDKQFGGDNLTKPSEPSGVDNTELYRGGSNSSTRVWRPGRVRNGAWIPGHWVYY